MRKNFWKACSLAVCLTFLVGQVQAKESPINPINMGLNLSAEVLENPEQAQQGVDSFCFKESVLVTGETLGLIHEAAKFRGDTPPKDWESFFSTTSKFSVKAYEVADQAFKAINNVAAGDYDEAVLRALYAGGELVGHPVFKAAIAAAIYTGESYKAVRKSTTGLQIEKLYDALNAERLAGTVNPQADQPALIPTDDETLNYFYQKYIWDDETTRKLVAAYVNSAFGAGVWSEDEWRRLQYAYINDAYSADPVRRAKLEELNNAFRKKAKSWIRGLINDLNGQVTYLWAAARLRQTSVGLRNYMQQVQGFNASFAQLKQQYESLEKLKANVPEWEKVLAGSPAALEKAKTLLANPKKLNEAQQLCAEWISKMRTATSGAHVVGEMKLFESLKVQRQAWYDIEKTLGDSISKAQASIIKDPTLVYQAAAGENISDEKKFYQDNFEQFMKPYKWIENPDKVKDTVLNWLNQGKFDEAYQAAAVLDNERSSAVYEYYEGRSGLLSEVAKKRDSINEEYQNRISELSTEIEKVREQYSAAAKHGRTQEEILCAQKLDTLKAQVTKEQGKIAICNSAYQLATSVSWALHEATTVEYGVTKSEIAKIIIAVQDLMQKRLRQWNEYKSFICGQIENALPLKGVTGQGTDFSIQMDEQVDALMSALDKLLEEAKRAEKYVANAPFDYATTLGELYRQMEKRSNQIRYGASIDTQEVTRRMGEAQELYNQWQSAADKWKNAPGLSTQELLEVQVLVDPDGAKTYGNRRAAIDRTIAGFPGLMSKINGKGNECVRLADETVKDRQQGSDWINDKLREVQSFFKAQEAAKAIKNKGSAPDPDYEVVVEKEMDMGISNTPYRHYMLEKDVAAYATEIMSGWDQFAGVQFLKTYAPKVYEKLKASAKPTGIKMASEDNVIVRTGASSNMTIWKSALDKLASAVDAVKYDASDLNFSMQMVTVSNVEGMASFLTTAASDKKVRYAVDESYKNYASDYDNALGKRYLEILEKLKKTFDEREEYLVKTETKGPDGGPGGPGEKPAGPDGGEPAKPSVPTKPTPTPFTPKKPASPISNYRILNPRINTVDVRSASGEVVIMADELRQGKIVITGSLSTTDNIDKMLISEDSGRTWKEMPVNRNLEYAITPMVGMRYDVVLKIKTKLLEEFTVPFFENISAIVYKNISYTQMVKDAVKQLADVYEAQNIAAFDALVSRSFIGNRVFLVEGVRFDFDMFNNIRLKIYIDRIEQRGGIYVAETHWDKTQYPRSTGQAQLTTGRTVMMFVLEDGKLQLQNLRGNLIYATLSVEIAQSSGLGSDVVNQIATDFNDRIPAQPGAGTTVESGGVSSSAPLTTRSATVISAPPPGGPGIRGLNFVTGAITTTGVGDFDFNNGNTFAMNGAAQIQLSGSSYDTITEAPTGGYAAVAGGMVAGNVYIFRTMGGFYGKMRVTSIVNNPPVNDTITFDYAVQTDGSRNINT